MIANIMKAVSLSFLFGIMVFSPLQAQDRPDPKISFLRSLAVPGWGHYYNDQDKWTRGKFHLGADLVLIGSYFGLNARSSNLINQYQSFARLRAGVSIDDRSRQFQLAVGRFNSLDEYNDFQLRSRNWDQILPDEPENRWEWNSSQDRQRYSELRKNSDQASNQLPAIAALMVVNRVVSAISAYRRARNLSAGPELTLLPAFVDQTQTGVLANLSFRF